MLLSILLKLFDYKAINVPLQPLHKHPHVITVANGVMNLNGDGEKALSVALEILAHGEHGQQEFALVKHVDVESRELQPRNHRDIEGVDGRAVLWRVARRLGILL